MPTEEKIRKLAYTLWEQEGRPEGRDTHYYFSAKQMLEEQEATKGRAKASRTKASRSPKTRTRSPRAKK